MDFFEHRYYRLNTTIMMLFGQWPYQSSRAKRYFRAAIIYANTSEIVSQILNTVKYRNNLPILLDCAVPLLINLVCVTNLIGFMSNSQKTLQLLNRIRTDWRVWAQHEEVNILHEYTEQGRKINILFTAMVYFTIFANVMQSSIPTIIDVLLENGTKPGKFPSHVEYYNIDTQIYYFYILMYYCLMLAMIFGVLTANNVMLVSYVQHACGLFAALGHKLNRITNNDTAMERVEISGALTKGDMIDLAWCIKRHNDAIEYANLIEGIYTWNVFFVIVFGMILSNLLLFQFFISTRDLEAIIKFTTIGISLLFLFWVDCYIAQILMDHSLNIHFHIYNNQWYILSCRAQKLLQIMVLRSTLPCQLTAKKVLILSVRTFGLTCRTGLSYFAVLRSMHT